MTIMEYNKFKNILNKEIFEESKSDLLKKISSNPERYIGFFRPTKPKGKLLQNLLQSHEIRFGDAFEVIIEEYVKIYGGEILESNFTTGDGESLNVDQIFRLNGRVYFVEQKVRDDHDSTKKRGQIQNFEKKLAEILKTYDEDELTGIFYFIDPDFQKNINYYRDRIDQLARDYGVELRLFYGNQLFEFLRHGGTWNEILEYLPKWKSEIPDLPEINFDLDSLSTFEEIKDLNPSIFRTLFSDDQIFTEIVMTLFPQKSTLKLLYDYFKPKSQSMAIYRTLTTLIEGRLKMDLEFY